MLRPESAQPLDTTAEIETPEHVRFAVRLAGPGPRGLAYLFDLLIKAAILLVLGLLWWIAGRNVDTLSGWSMGAYALVAFAVEWGYHVFFEVTSNGQSPGKRMFRLRVLKDGGHSINAMDALLRNLLRAADFLPSFYALGVVVMGLDDRFRRLGDLVAGTIVVVEERTRVGAAVRIRPRPTAAELATVPSHVPLTGEELEAIEAFVRRRPMFGPGRADELAELAEPVLSPKVRRPPGVAPARFLELLYHRMTARHEGAPR